MPQLKPGDKAPAFNLKEQDGKSVKLADYKGRKLLVYFYPKADTPGCTTQACSVRDARQDLKTLGIDAVGISPDEPAAQKKFDEKFSLGFPLLSDVDHAVADKYGVWGEKTSFGEKKMGVIRSAFVVDEAGKIVEAFYKVSPEETVPKAKAALGGQ